MRRGTTKTDGPSKRSAPHPDDALVQFYLSTFKELEPDVVRIFERKESTYTVHGETAKYVAQEYFHTLACIKNVGSKQTLPTVEMKREKFEEVVRSILLGKKNKRVELWARLSKTSGWTMTKKASPGNVQQFEELIYGESAAMEESPVTMAISFGMDGQHKVVGIAFVDTILRKIGACQFIDNVHLSNLEAALNQKTPKECVIARPTVRDEVDTKKVTLMADAAGIMLTEVPKAYFKAQDLEQDLTRLLGQTGAHIASLGDRFSAAALACLVKHAELLLDEDYFGRFKFVNFNLTDYMRLDRHAVRALNLLPEASDANKLFNLYGLLNRCRTPMGSRRLLINIKQPLLRIDDIEARLNMTEIFISDAELRSQLLQQLKLVPDLDRICKKFQRKKMTATLKDCVTLYDVVERLPTLVAIMQRYTGVHAVQLQDCHTERLLQIVTDFKDFTTLIQGAVDLEATVRHEYMINPNFEPEFTEIVKEKNTVKLGLDSIEAQARSVLEQKKESARTGPVSLQYGKKPCPQWYLSCPKALAAKIKRTSGYSILEEGAKMKVTTPQLTQLSRKYIALEEQLAAKQVELINQILEVVGSYTPVMENLADIIAELDVFLSFAQVGAGSTVGYCRPRLTEGSSGDIVLKQARHPCLEAQEGVDFIPNDVSLLRGHSDFQIITGPNMGGKSTYIRSAGTIILMAQIGCFVPCESATISIRDSILARIGASDSQLKGVSTFMAEMQETASILKTATPQSLIIIDELGRGTSTYDGFGLAWAISEHICEQIKCFCFFATHFHELTALAAHIPNATNLHVSADTQTGELVLLYRVDPGPSHRSFGIEISELAGFPPEVVQVARRKVDELEQHSKSEVMVGSASASLPQTGRKRRASEMAATSVSHSQSRTLGQPAPTKRSRTEPHENVALVRQFLRQFAQLPLSACTATQGIELISALRQQMLDHAAQWPADLGSG